MNSGIYQLSFEDKLFYIGQAQNIPTRISQHFEKLRSNLAAQKMQAAYRQYGFPKVRVMLYCHKDYLDIMEAYYINDFNKYTSCLNTSIPYFDPNIDYAMLIESKLLVYGSMEHMNLLFKTTQERDILTQKLDSLTKAHSTKLMQLRVEAETQQGRDENREYKELYPQIEEAYSQTQAELKKLQSRGLLQRIFNLN